MQRFASYGFLLLCMISAAAAETCGAFHPCIDVDASCVAGWCECSTGYNTEYYSNGDVMCIYNYYIIVVPIVVIALAIKSCFIIWYCIRRSRMARAEAQTTVWVQSPQTTMGVPVSVQAHPGMYPTQQYQAMPSAGYASQPQRYGGFGNPGFTNPNLVNREKNRPT